jgi:hypothetical protein
LWLNALASCPNPDAIISFLDKAISQLLKTPHTFLDKVQENASATTQLDKCEDGEAMETDNYSTTTNDALIKSEFQHSIKLNFFPISVSSRITRN